MAHIEGREGILHRLEFFGGMATSAITLFSGVAWMVAAYRPQERPAELIKLFSDFGWFIFDMTVMVTFIQYLSFGLCVLLDNRPQPLFPRWLGWLSFTVCATFLPNLPHAISPAKRVRLERPDYVLGGAGPVLRLGAVRDGSRFQGHPSHRS